MRRDIPKLRVAALNMFILDTRALEHIGLLKTSNFNWMKLKNVLGKRKRYRYIKSINNVIINEQKLYQDMHTKLCVTWLFDDYYNDYILKLLCIMLKFVCIFVINKSPRSADLRPIHFTHPGHVKYLFFFYRISNISRPKT